MPRSASSKENLISVILAEQERLQDANDEFFRGMHMHVRPFTRGMLKDMPMPALNAILFTLDNSMYLSGSRHAIIATLERNRTRIENIQMEITRLQRMLKDTPTIFFSAEELECVVCYEKTHSRIIPCNHVMCKSCFDSHLLAKKNRDLPTDCPMCRNEIDFVADI